MSIIKIRPRPFSAQEYHDAIQSMIDETARSKDFRDGAALASYFNSTVEPWADQAKAFVAWRDNVWQYVYPELSKVQAEERERPTIEDFLSELPRMIWPKPRSLF